MLPRDTHNALAQQSVQGRIIATAHILPIALRDIMRAAQESDLRGRERH
jgi:hypothetical protein